MQGSSLGSCSPLEAGDAGQASREFLPALPSSPISFFGLHHRNLSAVFSLPSFLEVLGDKDGFPELDIEN